MSIKESFEAGKNYMIVMLLVGITKYITLDILGNKV